MKKMSILSGLLLAVAILAGCASAPIPEADVGFFPPEAEFSEDQVTVGIKLSLAVQKFDGETYSELNKFGVIKTMHTNAGIHTFGILYQNGNSYTIFPITIITNLEAGHTYDLAYTITGNSIDYDCIDREDGSSAKLDLSALEGKSDNVISKYIDAVLNPTMDDVGKTVVQENDDWKLTSYPFMKFSLENKATGEVVEGYRGFVTDFSFAKGDVYLDVAEYDSKDAFLDSDYQKTAFYHMTVTACDGKTVTYTFDRPEEKKGQTVTLNISVID